MVKARQSSYRDNIHTMGSPHTTRVDMAAQQGGKKKKTFENSKSPHSSFRTSGSQFIFSSTFVNLSLLKWTMNSCTVPFIEHGLFKF